MHNITFFLHNVSDSEPSKSIPGNGSTWNYFDTTTDFNKHNTTLTASGTNNRFDWYLTPTLAGNVTTSSIILKIWAKAGLGSSQNAGITLEIYERSSLGTETLVKSNNYGSQTFPAVGTLWNWGVTFDNPHKFNKGSSIKVRLVANPGTGKIVNFYYDSLAANSRVIIPTSDHITVEDIETKDHEGNARVSFNLTSQNKAIDIRAQIDDPYGGYDIKWVNLTLKDSEGKEILSKVPMSKYSGTPISFSSVFNCSWNYSGYGSGRYNISIWALDNSGHTYFYHFQMYTYSEYPVTADGYFHIGGLPNFVWVLAKDASNNSMDGAIVKAMTGLHVSSVNTTDQNGTTNLTLYPGKYTFAVFWEGVKVGFLEYNVTSNITRENAIRINCTVFYPVLRVVDNASMPIHKAAIYMTHPNGSKLDPVQTNAEGNVSFMSIAGGVYDMVVRWRGVVINRTSIDIKSSGTYLINGSVYYIVLRTLDRSEVILTNIGITAFENSTGFILDFKMTNSSGMAVLRVPSGALDLVAYWMNMPVNHTYNLTVKGDMSLDMNCSIFSVPVHVLDSLGFAVQNAQVVFRTDVSGDLLGSGRTDDHGMVSVRLLEGRFHMEVSWKDIVINDTYVDIIGSGLLTVYTRIYYINMTTLDSFGGPVGDADVVVRSNQGSVLAARRTDRNGTAILRLPVGFHDMTVTWRTVIVNQSVIDVRDNVDLTVNLDVHYIEFTVLDTHMDPIKNALITLMLNSTSELLVMGSTDMNGLISLRSPATLIDIEVEWKSVMIFSEKAYHVMGPVVRQIISSVYYLTFNVHDSMGHPLQNALVIVKLSSTDSILDSNRTTSMGILVMRLPMAYVDIDVFWKNVLVYHESSYSITGDTVKEITSMVYYLTFRGLDSRGYPVEDASVSAYFKDDGSLIDSGLTDADGLTTLRLTVGSFFIETMWNMVRVNKTELFVQENRDEIVLTLSIFYFTLNVVDSRDHPVSDAVIYIHRSENGRILDSGLTSTAGLITLKLPGNDIDIVVYWDGIEVYVEEGYTVSDNMEKRINSHVFYLDLHSADMLGQDVRDAKVFLITNETIIKYKETSGVYGNATFRIPVDEYDIEIYWKNVLVHEDTIIMTDDLSMEAILSIYHITFETLDSKGIAIFSAQVYVYDHGTNDILNTGITNLDGRVTLKVPGTEVDLFSYLRGIKIYSEYNWVVNDNVVKTFNTDVYYVSMRVVDSAQEPVKDATITAVSLGTAETLAFGTTDRNGTLTLRIPKTRVNIIGEWFGHRIFEGVKDITDDVGLSNPMTLSSDVYYMNLTVLDDEAIVVRDAKVTFTSRMVGLIVSSVSTDANGEGTVRLPAGEFDISIAWNGAEVYQGFTEVVSDDSWTFTAKIFYFDIFVEDADGIAVEHATVSIVNSKYPSLGTSNESDENGRVQARLPIGLYDITVMWNDYSTARIDDYMLDRTGNLSIFSDIFSMNIRVIDERGASIENAWVYLYDSSSGDLFGAMETGSGGIVYIRAPKGEFDILILWYNVMIYSETAHDINKNEDLTADCDVFYLLIRSEDGDGSSISEVEIIVRSDEGDINIAGSTDGNGTVEFRLPGGHYLIEARLKRTDMLKDIDLFKEEEVDLTSSIEVELNFPDYPPSFFSTPLFYAVILPIMLLLLIIALVIYFYTKRIGHIEGEEEEEELEEDMDEKDELDDIEMEDIEEVKEVEEELREDIPEMESIEQTGKKSTFMGNESE